MITRSVIDKSTTIKKGTYDNFGLNPILMFNYGLETSRCLIHFNIDVLKKQINEGMYPNLNKLKHTLILKNCGSIDFKKNREHLPSSDINGIKERAVSFSIIAFKVNKKWDMGVGFDNTNDFWISGKSSVSYDGATWYNATTQDQWDDDGIYTVSFIESELNNYLNTSGETIIVGTQSFDIGNENLEMDLTDYVNKLIIGNEENNGICLMFSPLIENNTDRKLTQYVGFFNEKTNTIFTPILETRYDETIQDDRFSFYLNKNNKLYLYSIINNKFENLDELPTCLISGQEYEVKQESRGIYSISLKIDNKSNKADTILYDIWSNLKYQGEEIDDVENEFVLLPSNKFFSIDETIKLPKILNPILVGIDDNEKINQGETRLIKVFYKVPYTHSDYLVNDISEYRLYVKDGDREVDIIKWDKMLNIGKCCLFKLESETLVPTEYHIDIRTHFGEDIRIFKNKVTFKIVSNVTEQKL